MIRFIYLHGFASGPNSQKATAFKEYFGKMGISLIVPDLEGGDFQHLTLSRQIDTIQGCLDNERGNIFGMIGSSLGGYLASLMVQLRDEIKAAYLMAPAFNFLERWGNRLDMDLNKLVENNHLISVFHFRYNKNIPLNPFIFKDAQKWEKLARDRILPIRIVHGKYDETVDIEESRKFSMSRHFCELAELDTDHSLLSELQWILNDCRSFFQKEGLLK